MRTTVFFIILIITVLISCGKKTTDLGRIAGFTQGTTYSIIYDGLSEFSEEKIKAGISQILSDIDMSLSVYNDSSVISRINRNEDVEVDTFFSEVFRKSMKISEITEGAFDITVMPLVRAWGFGPDEHRNFDRSKLDSLLQLVGYKKISMEGHKVVRHVSGITLDANAIAQGYTVDILCRYFNDLGIDNYLVEVGGEVRVKGKKGNEYWKIGIDRPADSNMVPGQDLQAIVRLKDMSLATSGNYRKFYVENGVKYSHTIDPVSGYPARNRLLSTTIITDECAYADGLATACMVMGLEKSMEFISNNPGIEAYLIYSDDNGDYKTWRSKGFEKFLVEEGAR